MDFFVENNVVMPTDIGGSVVIVNPVYEARGVFSVNASGELQGSLWMTKDGQKMASPSLGVASYTVRDKNGNTVGLSESGISVMSSGFFKITPVDASVIADLTHYTVDISIVAEGVTRAGVVGIVIGE